MDMTLVTANNYKKSSSICPVMVDGESTVMGKKHCKILHIDEAPYFNNLFCTCNDDLQSLLGA